MSCPQTAAVSCYRARAVTVLTTQQQPNKININRPLHPPLLLYVIIFNGQIFDIRKQIAVRIRSALSSPAETESSQREQL